MTDVNVDDNWWPSCLSHIPEETPWRHDSVSVAEIRSFEDELAVGCRLAFTALVPMAELEVVRKSLSQIDHEVSTSGPRPFASNNDAYRPHFSVDGHQLPSQEYEPLDEIRKIRGHTATDKKAELSNELKRFGVSLGEEASGYGLILDRTYDELIAELTRVNQIVTNAIDVSRR